MKKNTPRLLFLPDDERQRIEILCSKLSVPDRLNHPHELIQHTAEYFKLKERHNHSFREEVINISVSVEHLSRSLRIMDTIIKTLETLGYSIKNTFRETKVVLGKDQILIRIKEKEKRIDHVWTAEETAQKIAAQKYHKLYWPPPEYDYIPTGKLTFIIDEYWAPRKNWNDTDNQRIEEHVGEIIIYILEAVNVIKELREERELERQHWQEEQERRRKIQELKDNEKKKLKKLKNESKNYQQARQIRDYVMALEIKAADLNNIKERNQLLEYIEWARSKADWLDPLLRTEDPILGLKLFGDDLDD